MDQVRTQISFYGSTPAYRGVLELHGWSELQPELNSLSRAGEWTKMAALIDDDVLEEFSIIAPVSEVGQKVMSRFGNIIDRFNFYCPYSLKDECRREMFNALQSLQPIDKQ